MPRSHPAFVTLDMDEAALGTRDPRCLTPSVSPEEATDVWETFV